jgi:hypothetical protein
VSRDGSLSGSFMDGGYRPFQPHHFMIAGTRNPTPPLATRAVDDDSQSLTATTIDTEK